MKRNEEELQKELKELKMHGSLNPQIKEQMKSAIKKHARKKRKRRKFKQAAILASTAAALILASILVFNLISNNQSVLPADDHDELEHDSGLGEKQPSDSVEGTEISVIEGETENGIIMLEGMEEEGVFTNYTLEPYGIHFQIEEFLGNYQVEDDPIEYYSDADNAWVKLEVEEDASLDAVVSDLQSQYTGDFSYTEEPSETSQEENPYEGISQHFSDPPQGYYAYQIGGNVLVIQYEYDIEVADGMGGRLQALRESIE